MFTPVKQPRRQSGNHSNLFRKRDIYQVKKVPIKPPRWQERLLPIMEGLLIGLTLFFFISTFIQMTYLHQSILQTSPIEINPVNESALLSQAGSFEEKLNGRQLEIRSHMEAYIVTQRYHQANVVLMANLWIRYLGFITGMMLALVGASFVLGKLREPLQRVEGKLPTINFSLRTTSPGIILVFLGVILMFTTLVDEDYYKVTDGNVYLNPSVIEITSTATNLDTLLPPRLLTTPVPSKSAP